MSDKNEDLSNRIENYLNPFERLGLKKYSATFPLIITFTATILTEIYAQVILDDPSQVGLIAIFLFIALIVYFSFRDGLIGGFTASSITILYYLYIVLSRQDNPASGIYSTIMFGIAYYTIAAVIGWLRQSIDNLIEKETYNKRRLDKVVQQLPVGVIISDKNGKIEIANKQAEKILDASIPKGRSIEKDSSIKITHAGKPINSIAKFLENIIKKNEPVIGKEFEIEALNGKKIYIQASTDVIKNDNNEPIAFASIFSDITEQKEHELRKDDFINMASHELKTPLTSMKLYLDSLDSYFQETKPDGTTKAVNGIKLQVKRLELLVMELLDVSRMQSGKLTYSYSTFKLEELIKETIEAVESGNKKKRITFRSNTSTIINADRFRISQVLINLLSNALKYSPDKSKIAVKIKKNDKKAIVSITDKGIGIDKRQHEKIFERLYQVSDKYEKTFPGLGMGLFISKQIIDDHKGKIWVDSKKGRGSTFFFSIPLIKEQREI